MMTTQLNRDVGHRQAGIKPHQRQAIVRPATVPQRVTRLATIWLEFNFGRGLFDDEPQPRDDRHPEWYIG